jgi:membrane-bound lytic murein transglycosylase D
MWQFMDFTARRYGLRVSENWKHGGYDERTDVAKATHIAAKYLYDLLSEFGSDSFMLAIASYNKGEAGMRKILHEVGFRKEQRDFWHLYRLKKLPEETMEYVPQILAAAIICSDPKKYGLE